MAKTTHYVPGVCNINPVEIKRRRISAHIGVIVSIIIIALIFTSDITWYLRIIVIIPLFIAAIGYLQARNKFCVAYAAAKQQHADDGPAVAITNSDDQIKDAAKSRKLNLYATLIAAALTAIICIIPA